MPDKIEGLVASDNSIKLLNNIILKSYADALSTLSNANLGTKSRRIKTLKEIEKIDEEMKNNVQQWVSVTTPSFYEQGMFEAISKIHNNKDGVRINIDFAGFHRESIEALADETYQAMAEGMTGLTRTAERVVASSAKEAIQAEIAKGAVLGQDVRTIKKGVQDILKQEGITSLRDKGGKNWDLKRYSEMLARTKLTKAHNTGLANRMLESGYDLVQVTSHSGTCPLCSPWENKILSLTGRVKGYPTLAEAEDGGLFHPNCRHTYSPYHGDYLKDSKIWDTEKQAYVNYKDSNLAMKFSDIKNLHEESLKEMGINNIADIGRMIEQGKKKELNKLIAKIPDTNPNKTVIQNISLFA